MHISNINNYNALMHGMENAWCYSKDGINIKAADSLKDKFLYIIRAVLFLNGNKKTLKTAILNSFTPIDKTLIEGKLADLKSIRKAKKEKAEQSEVPPQKALETLLTKALEDVSIDSMMYKDKNAVELKTKKIQQLLKVHKVFKKIHALSKELDSHHESVKGLLNQTIEDLQYRQFKDLFQAAVDGVEMDDPSRFIEEFFDRMPEGLTKIYEAFENWGSNELSLLKYMPKYKDAGAMESAHKFIDGLNNYDHQMAEALEKNPGSQRELNLFGRAFHDFILEQKKDVLRNTVKCLLVVDRYQNYPYTPELVEEIVRKRIGLSLKNFNEEDQGLFKEAWDQRMIQCRNEIKQRYLR